MKKNTLYIAVILSVVSFSLNAMDCKEGGEDGDSASAVPGGAGSDCALITEVGDTLACEVTLPVQDDQDEIKQAEPSSDPQIDDTSLLEITSNADLSAGPAVASRISPMARSLLVLCAGAAAGVPPLWLFPLGYCVYAVANLAQTQHAPNSLPPTIPAAGYYDSVSGVLYYNCKVDGCSCGQFSPTSAENYRVCECGHKRCFHKQRTALEELLVKSK